MGRPRLPRETRCCLHCGESFETVIGQEKIYCSRDCYQSARTGVERGPYAVGPSTKKCEVCGEEFRVGGRGNPPRRQRLCSDACQRKSRFRRGAQSAALTPAAAAYLAGIIDGEGTIMLYLRRDAAALALMVSNTYVPLLEWVVEQTGVGHIQNTREANERHKASYFWRCNSDAADSVIRQIRPYLIVKAEQAELAILTQDGLRDPARKSDRSWQEDAVLTMKALNRRGPRPAELYQEG